MIKCPNCGSSTQVEVVGGDNLGRIWVGSMGVVHQYCECGCGCSFTRQFVLDKVFTIENEEEDE